MYNEEALERCNELESAQEILTQKLERLERAVWALANGGTNPVSAGAYAQSILTETYPI